MFVGTTLDEPAEEVGNPTPHVGLTI